MLIALLSTVVLGTNAQDGTSFTHAGYRFQVDLPQGWEAQVEKDERSALVVHFHPAGATPEGRWSIQAQRAPAGAQERQLIEAAKLSAVGREDIGEIVDIERELLGRAVPGVALDAEVGGLAYHSELCYLIDGKELFLVQSLALREQFDSFEPSFAALRHSFVRPAAEAGEASVETRLESLAGRCGAGLDWAASWEAAAARAAEEQKLVLVYADFLEAFAITDEVLSGTFMDPDVRALIEARYVPLHLRRGMRVPFAAQEAFGLGPLAFGKDLLVVSPEGVVLRHAAGLALDYLVEAAVANDRGATAADPLPTGLLEQAEWHVRRGAYDAAVKRLEEEHGARAELLRAQILRRQRRGEAALAALERVRAAPDASEVAVELPLEEARVALGLGRFEDARQALEAALGLEPDSERGAEARYFLGAVEQRLGALEQATARWRTLALERPDSPWAWRAAADLTSTSIKLGIRRRLEWPESAHARLLVSPPLAPLAYAERARALESALAYLLDTQEEDGSWLSPEELRTVEEQVGDFELATTAICCRALLAERAEPRVCTAIERALAFVLRAHRESRAAGEKAYFMDYAVWSHSAALDLIARCLRAGVGERAELVEEAGHFAAELYRRQRPDGGWTYYLTSDLESSAPSNMPSISFTTAAVVLALEEARSAGLAIDEQSLERGLDRLRAMRNEAGCFEYMSLPGEGRHDSVGAAGRGPLCNLALLGAGPEQSDALLGDLMRSLERFAKHHGLLDHERGKALMHCGPEGLGSHYVLFDYAMAAESLSRLGRTPERSGWSEEIASGLLCGRAEDGSYCDNPLIGRDCGTGLALIALQALR